MVTGCSSGLGLRFAEILAENGTTVVCCARRAQRLEAFIEKIGVNENKAIALTLDVIDEDAVNNAFDKIETE